MIAELKSWWHSMLGKADFKSAHRHLTFSEINQTLFAKSENLEGKVKSASIYTSNPPAVEIVKQAMDAIRLQEGWEDEEDQ